MQNPLQRPAQNKNVAWILIGATILLLISTIGQRVLSMSDKREHLICEDMGSLDPKSEAYAAKVMDCLKDRLAQPQK